MCFIILSITSTMPINNKTKSKFTIVTSDITNICYSIRTSDTGMIANIIQNRDDISWTIYQQSHDTNLAHELKLKNSNIYVHPKLKIPFDHSNIASRSCKITLNPMEGVERFVDRRWISFSGARS